MREIKFRYFDKKKNVMRDWEYVGQTFTLSALEDNKNNEFYSSWMQYTGLRDMKGKEIYEGDVVFVTHRLVENMENFTAEIVWEHGGYKVDKKINSFIGFPLSVTLDGIAYEFEVIGNRYENPELVC